VRAENDVRFEIVSRILHVEVIASGRGVRDLLELRRMHGEGRWRKLKGIASVRLPGGWIRLAEIHWYEAHGIGKRDFKIKRYLD
jgi:hypothetical protein